MSDVVISVENLGKKYRLGAGNSSERYTALRDVLTNKAKNLFRRNGSSPSNLPTSTRSHSAQEEFWALKEVSFEVKQGEVVGIIGRNGAGKSTLLKILSRITEPTEGRIKIEGRVASLLEVGTGFHPELTGRENIYLNGAILGMARTEIKSKFDEIVAFAEVGKFLETPVKRYSSGMYVRLAFAVAAHLEPEILVVDEVLAVGDAEFQKKCLGKMRDVARGGRTVLFVSHNMEAVRQLCSRALILNVGRVERAGKADSVIDSYLALSQGHSAEYVWGDRALAPGNDVARLLAVRIVDQNGVVCSSLPIDESFFVEIEYAVLFGQPRLNLSVSLFTSTEIYVLASASTSDGAWYQRPQNPGMYRSRCEIPGALLNAGRYMVTALLVENATVILAQADKVVWVEMLDSGKNRGNYFGDWGGVIRPNLRWQTMLLESRI